MPVSGLMYVHVFSRNTASGDHDNGRIAMFSLTSNKGIFRVFKKDNNSGIVSEVATLGTSLEPLATLRYYNWSNVLDSKIVLANNSTIATTLFNNNDPSVIDIDSIIDSNLISHPLYDED